MSETIRKLSVLDSAFLFAETAECPMHVGSLTIVNPFRAENAALIDGILPL